MKIKKGEYHSPVYQCCSEAREDAFLRHEGEMGNAGKERSELRKVMFIFKPLSQWALPAAQRAERFCHDLSPVHKDQSILHHQWMITLPQNTCGKI